MRARDLGIVIGAGQPGPLNAITDVAGVRVGHATLIEGDDVRTGVTVILPHEGTPLHDPVFAGCHRLNGNGELTGLEWVRESGLLTSPIGLTNTHSVGVVRDALVAWSVAEHPAGDAVWSLPVVGETYDGELNDINGMHVRAEHVRQAIESATSGPVAEGSVGGGTGMICHDFKGGIGTASRLSHPHTVGVLVQANYGRRGRLRVNGIPVGERLGDQAIPLPSGRMPPAGAGSIIAVVATDAPLLPGQCARLAQRAGLGVARMGGVGEHQSGDLFICFATGNRGLWAVDEAPTVPVQMLGHSAITGLFDAVVEAVEEAILNAMLAARTMSGRGGTTVHGLDPALLARAMAG